ncbi:MAG: hypothetical protein KC491_15635, partial [Dehalococcoidia bacterium]|nr:hypothetical protein [Dehalococcoidia bacterium]
MSDVSGQTTMTMSDVAMVGSRAPRHDARDKVHGITRYADDVALVGMLHAKVVRSAHACARLVSVDISRA